MHQESSGLACSSHDNNSDNGLAAGSSLRAVCGEGTCWWMSGQRLQWGREPSGFLGESVLGREAQEYQGAQGRW